MHHLSELRENAEIFKRDASGEYAFPLIEDRKYRINILALGDVGGTLLLGLVLLGGDTVESIGIFDIKPDNAFRFEAEMNQIMYPANSGNTVKTEVIQDEEELFNCDVFVFCATKEVPGLNSDASDIRMAQYTENRKIIGHYAKLASLKSFGGIFAVVSDPVDLLCKAAYITSGLRPGQFRGFGLGVMNSRAMYHARREAKFAKYIKEGRVFGPHGEGLVVADSISNYDDEISGELTKAVVSENLRIRQAGFKPFIAPAISSGAISILNMLRREWHYSSCYIGYGTDGAFFGALNRISGMGPEFENQTMPAALFERVKYAYNFHSALDL